MAIYVEINERVEKICEIIYFIVAKMTPACVVFPKFFGCLLVYFTTDLGSEALVLPLPMWFVCQLMDLLLAFPMTTYNQLMALSFSIQTV